MVLVVCDSSSLISLSESCNISVLPFLKEEFGLNFVIPPAVQEEIISHPLKVKKFAFSAVRLRKLLDDKVLQVITSPTLMKESKRILEESNSLFRVRNRPLQILQEGEAQCVALFSSISANLLLVDEKTTRMLLEDAGKLAQTVTAENGKDCLVDESKYSFFSKLGKEVRVIRSTELLALAFEKGFFDGFKDNKSFAFHAALYALRKSGCSISTVELDEYEELYS
ncbi:MAG: hypothetical protein ABH803_04425 [Candidatus Micrarchaeota archaeon]